MKNLHEISTNDFRQKFKSLGHSENRSELTSGGEISSEFLDVLSKFIDEWTQIGGGSCKVMFTSGNDNFHKNLGGKSRHSVGQAVDLTLPNSCHTKFIELLNTYKSKYDGFSYIDEYRNPSKHATGGHFHLSYSKGKPEGGGVSTSTGTNTSTTDTKSGDITWNTLLSPLKKGLNAMGINEEVEKIKRLMK
jgi:hypothetical protein